LPSSPAPRPSSQSGIVVRPGVTPTPTGTSSVRPSSIREAAAEAHAIAGGAVRPSGVVRSTGRKTILLIDPDAELRAHLRARLEPDYEVIEASDGMEAVEMMSSIPPPAMIVAETALPRVDGFTLAKIVRNHPLMKRVPLMFVSSQDSPQHVTQALVIGVRQYLPKTTPVPQIVEKIRKFAV
jgi:PleD family two-component response regulator